MDPRNGYLLERLKVLESQMDDLRGWRNRVQGVALVLGFLGGVVAAGIIRAVLG